MCEDIHTIALDKIRASKQFCLQLDQFTDIGKNAQLLDNVCFVESDGDVIREKLPFFVTS